MGNEDMWGIIIRYWWTWGKQKGFAAISLPWKGNTIIPLNRCTAKLEIKGIFKEFFFKQIILEHLVIFRSWKQTFASERISGKNSEIYFCFSSHQHWENCRKKRTKSRKQGYLALNRTYWVTPRTSVGFGARRCVLIVGLFNLILTFVLTITL